jgi:tetratricopeptide (TPR) repeat protein
MPRLALLLAVLLLPLQAVAADAADDRAALYQQYRQAFDAGEYQRALPLAMRVVELTSNQFGPDAQELVNPLTNLATTLLRLGQHMDAVDAYRRALTLLDLGTIPSDPRFVAPLHGLGATLREMDRHEDAIVPLKRAVEIIRNRDGLHAPEQLPILRALIACYQVTGRETEATREHQYAYTIAEQLWGSSDLRMLPVLEEFAAWYETIGRYSSARVMYQRAAQLADRNEPMGLKAIPALRGMARNYRLGFIHGENSQALAPPDELPESIRRSQAYSTGLSTAEGERALRNALQRLEPHGASHAAERGAVLVDLGDWYRTAGLSERALAAWRDAWRELNLAGDTSPLARPEPVVYRAPPIATSQRKEDLDEYSIQEVELRVAIGADGALRDLTVANPAKERESAERAVVAALRRATWRPAFENGQPVATTDFIFREKVYVKLPRGSRRN